MANIQVDYGKRFDMVSPIADTWVEGQFHLSYWYDERDDTPLADAAQRVTRRVAESLGLRPDDHVLDAGCGPGATGVLVAKETGARLTGITLSNWEIGEANAKAAAAGVADLARFEYGDYMALRYPDGSFDAVMAIESLLGAPDLDQVLREFFRVLRPGGRVSLCHCTLEAEMPQELSDRFAHSIMSNRLPTLAEWIAALRRAGFAIQEYLQMGPRVYGHRPKYFRAVEQIHDRLVARHGEEAVVALRNGVEDFFAPGPEYIGYAVVTAHKPYAD